ncbi:MAG: NPCBM/NEW2 domain-containing protein [Planctomycetia bacterium]|nr:NPCBM/NEW2 domain-containing protein [Planctomycetia bacterium]
MKRLILALVAVCLCHQAPAQDPALQGVPTSLLRVFEKAESDIRRNREEYEKANDKTLAEFNKTVKKEVDRLSKAGKPEEALALKDSAEAWFQQAMGGSAPDAVPQVPTDQGDKRKNPNGRVCLVDIKPLTTEGVFVVEEQHEGKRPLINGQPTTEPFIFTTAPSKLAWEVPDGKKVFRAYAYYLACPQCEEGRTAVMEVHADGKPIARSAVISINNRLALVEAKIPRGTKTLLLVTDPNGDSVYDNCLWVNPSFFDR